MKNQLSGLTECQKRLLAAMPNDYYVENGRLKKYNTACGEESALEYFLIETYGE